MKSARLGLLFLAIFGSQVTIAEPRLLDSDCEDAPVKIDGMTESARCRPDQACATATAQGETSTPGAQPQTELTGPSAIGSTQTILERLHSSSTPESRVQEAVTTPAQNSAGAARDTQILNSAYKNQNQTDLIKSLQQSQLALSRSVTQLQQSQSQLDPAERMRQMAHLQNAQDVARDQEQRLRDPAQPWKQQNLTPAQFVFNQGGTPTAAAPQSTDALLQRLIQLQGLPKEKQDQLAASLSMVQPTSLVSKDGSHVNFQMVHNGGANPAGPIDCHSTFAQTLSAESRRGSLSAIDLQAIYNIGAKGTLGKGKAGSIQYQSIARERFVRKMSVALAPVNVAPGAKNIRAGDLLVYRVKESPVSKVLIVRTYDPRTGKAQAIESSSATGPVREVEVNLQTQAQGADSVGIATAGQSEVFGLRLHPQTSVCTAAVELRDEAFKVRPSSRPKF